MDDEGGYDDTMHSNMVRMSGANDYTQVKQKEDGREELEIDESVRCENWNSHSEPRCKRETSPFGEDRHVPDNRNTNLKATTSKYVCTKNYARVTEVTVTHNKLCITYV